MRGRPLLVVCAAAAMAILCAWFVLSVRMSTRGEPLDAPCTAKPALCAIYRELAGEYLLADVLTTSVALFGPNASLVAGVMAGSAAAGRSKSVALAGAATALSFVLGVAGFGLISAPSVYDGLSRDKGTLHDALCDADEGNAQYCHFVTDTMRLLLALFVVQCVLLLYNVANLALVLREESRAPLRRRRRACSLAGVLHAFAIAVVLAGFATWAVARVGVAWSRTTDSDPVLAKLTPFSVFLGGVSTAAGCMRLLDRGDRRRYAATNAVSSSIASMVIGGAVAYELRRLYDEDFALYGETPCAALNPVLVELHHAKPHDLCFYETLNVVAMFVTLGGFVAQVLLNASVALICPRELLSDEEQTICGDTGGGGGVGGAVAGEQPLLEATDL